MTNKDKPYFTYKQLLCIDLLAVAKYSQVNIASEIAVNPMTITRWKKDPKFMHAVLMQSRALLKEDLPAVYSALAEESKAGSAQHIKIMLDHMADLENAITNQASITFTWKGSKNE